MKVRITSDNIHDNKNFELWNGNNPNCWWADGSTSNINDQYWSIEASKRLYSSRKLKIQGDTGFASDYIKVVKSGEVLAYAGGGSYFNTPSIEHVLPEGIFIYTLYEDLAPIGDISSVGLDREFIEKDSESKLRIKNLATYLTIETNMLRIPAFADNKISTPLIVQEKNSKRLEEATSYNPVSITLSFLNCLEENQAIKAYFQTLSYYGVGFTVEIWELQSEGGNWGNVRWGNSKWGGFNSGYGYGKKYTFDIAGSNFEEASTYGRLDISAILQKTEMGYANS
jgi:hypothetical protein